MKIACTKKTLEAHSLLFFTDNVIQSRVQREKRARCMYMGVADSKMKILQILPSNSVLLKVPTFFIVPVIEMLSSFKTCYWKENIAKVNGLEVSYVHRLQIPRFFS